MADQTSKFHSFVNLCDDLLALAKDFAIVAFVVLFLFSGAFLRDKLTALGISELGPIKLTDVQTTNQQVKNAASSVASLENALTDLEATITRSPSHTPAEVKQWTAEIETLKNQASSADASLKSTLLTQQGILQKASQPIETSGWILAGQVDESRKAWFGEGAKNIASPPPAPNFEPEQILTLASNVFLHKDPPPGQWHVQGEVIAVLKQGAQVQVFQVDMTSHAKSGGYFVWLQVKQL